MFIVSKLLSAFTQPMFWLVLWWVGALLLLRRHTKLAVRMLWGGVLAVALLGVQAIPDALLRTLENRYPVPSTQELARHVGVIVLGGAIKHPDSFLAHHQVPLGEAAERMSLPVGLVRQFPQLDLVFSGGEGRLLTTGVSEAELARQFYQEQGLNMAKVWLEGGSRNTRENAQQVAKLLGARCQEPWLLVTSASHMPRALPEFIAVACNVTPYPVDFATGESTAWREYSLAHSLIRWQTALHEYLGLFVYYFSR